MFNFLEHLGNCHGECGMISASLGVVISVVFWFRRKIAIVKVWRAKVK